MVICGTGRIDGCGINCCAGSQGAGSRGVRRQVQLEHCAAVCTQIAPCIGGAALAVSERHIHGRRCKQGLKSA